eukprot:2023341-Pleurochrysis_carterae.AAC.1
MPRLRPIVTGGTTCWRHQYGAPLRSWCYESLLVSAVLASRIPGPELSRAARAASRAAEAARAPSGSLQPAAVAWAGLDLAGWRKTSALSLFKLQTGEVRFTAGRAVAKPLALPSGDSVEVQLGTVAGEPAVWTPVHGLVSASDAALAGVLSWDGRRGASVPGLRVHTRAATLSPVEGAAPRDAVELTVAGDDPRVVPLDVALLALGLQGSPIGAPAPTSGGGGSTAAPQQRALPLAWLLGGGGGDAHGRRRASQLRTMGVSTARASGISARSAA